MGKLLQVCEQKKLIFEIYRAAIQKSSGDIRNKLGANGKGPDPTYGFATAQQAGHMIQITPAHILLLGAAWQGCRTCALPAVTQPDVGPRSSAHPGPAALHPHVLRFASCGRHSPRRHPLDMLYLGERQMPPTFTLLTHRGRADD